MGITNKDILKTVAIDVPNMKEQLDSNVQEVNNLKNSKADVDFVTNELKLKATKGDVESLNVEVQKKATKEELVTESERINNLVANAGNTDGNAELLDIRVGFDGVTYSTAGQATRALSNYMIEENQVWGV